MENLNENLEEILEEDIHDEDISEELEEWDSLSILNLISFIDKEYCVNLYTSDIKKTKTVKDLTDLIKAKQG